MCERAEYSGDQECCPVSEAMVTYSSNATQYPRNSDQLRSGHERLQYFSRRLVEVQENERRSIARELHDEASQAITGLIFGLRLLEKEVQSPEKVLLHLEELKSVAEGILAGIHRLAMGLRPASLDRLGLAAALEQLVKDTRAHCGLDVYMKTGGFQLEERLPELYELNIYRIVQEALTNAVRHAGAQNIDVILEYKNGKIVVIVEDDGAGFHAVQASESGHLGVIGMQERAQMIAGTLEIESIPGARTTVVLEVDYDGSNHHR